MAITIQYERPVSHAAHWARRLSLFSCLLFVAVVLSHRFGPLTTPHFLALAGFASMTAALAVVLAAIGLARLWQVGARGGKASLAALLFALLPLGVAAAALYSYFYKPALYDVTTDTVSVPPWLAVPSAEQDWLPRAAMVTPRDREVQLEAYPGLSGRRYEGALDRVHQGARKVAAAYGIAITAEDGLDNILADLEDLVVDPNKVARSAEALGEVPIPEARPLETPLAPHVAGSGDVLLQGEWRSPVFGFRFDVVIRLREEAETTLVDMRAASRYGPHDLGIGAELVEGYLKALDAELLGIAGD
ncbi:DUF1499 domain-containing protein [Shinella sp. NM-101]|uniref:DUF1499 domain-containing protein n=1 Tax=Shinella sp. NM-101 TaxID=2744455 RepID=UPI002104570D|nr:DUF1499 domain-containing protein [Shinella sp. NM-101]